MKRITSFTNIVMTLLLASTAVLSCSMETDMLAPGNNNMESDAALKGNKVVITGVVANEDGLPLKGIHVSFLEYRENGEESMPVGSVNTMTDDKGYYTIYADGPAEPIHCFVNVEDTEGIYAGQTAEIFVSWSGPSFDKASNMFVVNDCNFVLKKNQ